MKRSLAALLFVCLASLFPAGAVAQEKTALSVVSLSPNLSYSKSLGAEKYFAMEVNESSELKVALAHDVVDGPRETVASMCKRNKCIAGINGDFFGGPVPLGGISSRGRLLRTPSSSHGQIVIASDGLSFTSQPGDYRVQLSNGSQNVRLRVNVALNLSSSSIYTHAFGGALYVPNQGYGRIYRCTCKGRPDVYGKTYTLDLVRQVASGFIILNPNEIAVLARGDFAKRLPTWPKTRVELVIPKFTTGDAIGANPVIVKNGLINSALTDVFALSAHPRSLLAANKAGKKWLIAIDSRVTLQRAAQIAKGLGATEAINLDGGGSTTFVVRGTAVNNPADRAERMVSSAILVVQKTTNTHLINPKSNSNPGLSKSSNTKTVSGKDKKIPSSLKTESKASDTDKANLSEKQPGQDSQNKLPRLPVIIAILLNMMAIMMMFYYIKRHENS